MKHWNLSKWFRIFLGKMDHICGWKVRFHLVILETKTEVPMFGNCWVHNLHCFSMHEFCLSLSFYYENLIFFSLICVLMCVWTKMWNWDEKWVRNPQFECVKEYTIAHCGVKSRRNRNEQSSTPRCARLSQPRCVMRPRFATFSRPRCKSSKVTRVWARSRLRSALFRRPRCASEESLCAIVGRIWARKRI